jgi:hypothetical protein
VLPNVLLKRRDLQIRVQLFAGQVAQVRGVLVRVLAPDAPGLPVLVDGLCDRPLVLGALELGELRGRFVVGDLFRGFWLAMLCRVRHG